MSPTLSFSPSLVKAGLAALIVLLVPGLSAGQAALENKDQFVKIAKNGFNLVVNGNIFANPTVRSGIPNLVTNANGGQENSYAWSMAWYNGQLYVGTDRMVFCTSAYTGGNPPPVCTNSLVDGQYFDAALPGPLWRGEIWRYTPGNGSTGQDQGLSGTWQRFYQSPYWELPALWYLVVPTTVPRDLGYRMMTTCDAGDGIDRLYIATFGLPGNILYYEVGASAPQKTSKEGTYTTDTDLQAFVDNQEPFDLGYRALTCFKRRLWASPAGTFSDPDASAHPVVLMNPDPAHGAAWQQVLDVSNPDSDTGIPGFSSPDNGGIFQMEALGDYLFVSVGNRAAGFELWRGHATDAECDPTDPDGPCTLTWDRLITHGAGRPVEIARTTPANAGATLGVFGNDLYLGAGESGYAAAGLTMAELLRIQDAGSGNTAWEVVVGWPRQNYADLEKNGTWNDNFLCKEQDQFDLLDNELVDYSGGGLSFYFPGFLDDAEDQDTDDCRPSSGYGPGMGTASLTDLTPAYNKFSAEFYFWRMQEHQDAFYIGTLGNSSLWRTADGLDFSRVFTSGFDNPNNIGLRTLASTPWGLAVGTANPLYDVVDSEGKPAAGAEVLLGTSLLQDRTYVIPPIARAAVNLDPNKDGAQEFHDNDGDGYIDFFDDGGPFDNPAPGLVDVYLKDDGSYAPFAREPLHYEWYQGTLADCADPAGLVPECASTTPGEPVNCTFRDIPSAVGDNQSPRYTFTLRVFNAFDGARCDTVSVTASSNLPPQAQVIPSIPFAQANRVNLIDFDASGGESYELTGDCTDPANEDIVQCQWVPIDGGNALSSIQGCTFPTEACQTTADLQVMRTDLAPTPAPRMSLVVKDAHGYTSSFNFDTLVQSAAPEGTATNIAPVCRNLVVHTIREVPVTIDPIALQADGHPICYDRDGDAMTFAVRTPLPSKGTATSQAGPPPVINYQPNPGFIGEDVFYFRADDSNSNGLTRYSQNVAIKVINNDDVLCVSGPLAIEPTMFTGYSTRASDISISTTGSVVIQNGADVIFNAPQHNLGAGFTVVAGGKLKIHSQEISCM